MTRRPRRSAPLALVALLALAGCQDYNFSPVNQCLIQPGTERVTLSDISTADILFVVDDSGSMGGEQQSLRQSFGAFVTNLKDTNQVRVTNGLEPIDFHIAITTTSVFLNRPVAGGATCQSSCGGKAGQVCCETLSNQPLTAPRPCASSADCTGAGGPWTCKDGNVGLSGELTCGDAAGNPLLDPVGCATLGRACGQIQQRYTYTHGPRSCLRNEDCRNGDTCRTGCTGAAAGALYCCNGAGAIDQLQCNPGISAGESTLYPRGDFVKALDATSPVGPKPRVIHFDKDLFCTRTADGSACACLGAGAPATCDPPVVDDAELARRIDWFNANVMVGTCGSGQEQGLEAARRAVKKALRQDGLSQPDDVDGQPPAWPHPRSKLVTVWVGDEDDCSSPEDASAGVIFSLSGDACEADGSLPADQQKRYPLEQFSSFLTGLGPPLATGFIVSATGESCVDGACRAGICCDTVCTGSASVCTLDGVCGGQGAGYRFVDLAGSFTTIGSDVVVGSICHPGGATGPDFSSILNRVADVVKQPSGLQLPTQPASASVTILRIAGSDGKTRKTCSAPAPVGTTGAALDDYDWWFTDGSDLNNQVPTGASRFIYINRSVLRCTANPGETYSADYLGLVPSGGCDGPVDCEIALGVRKTPWVCQKEAGAAQGHLRLRELTQRAKQGVAAAQPEVRAGRLRTGHSRHHDRASPVARRPHGRGTRTIRTPRKSCRNSCHREGHAACLGGAPGERARQAAGQGGRGLARPRSAGQAGRAGGRAPRRRAAGARQLRRPLASGAPPHLDGRGAEAARGAEEHHREAGLDAR